MMQCSLLAKLGLAPILATSTASKPTDSGLACDNAEIVEVERDSATSPKCWRALCVDGTDMSLAMDSNAASGIISTSTEELTAQAKSAYSVTNLRKISLVPRAQRYGLLTSETNSWEVRLSRSNDNPPMRGLSHFQLLNDGEFRCLISNVGVVETMSSPQSAAFRPSGSREAAL